MRREQIGKPSARSDPTSAPSLAFPGPEHRSTRLLRVHTHKTGRDWFTQAQVSSKSGPEDLLGASGTLDRNAVPAPLAGAPPFLCPRVVLAEVLCAVVGGQGRGQ